MPELIDRYATIDAIPAPADADEAEYYGKVCYAIEAMPTISQEVRHGRWDYRHEDDWCYCSVCGTDAEGSDGECLETDYCPHCGARMDLRTQTEVSLDEADSVMMGGTANDSE